MTVKATHKTVKANMAHIRLSRLVEAVPTIHRRAFRHVFALLLDLYPTLSQGTRQGVQHSPSVRHSQGVCLTPAIDTCDQVHNTAGPSATAAPCCSTCGGIHSGNLGIKRGLSQNIPCVGPPPCRSTCARPTCQSAVERMWPESQGQNLALTVLYAGGRMG